MATRVMLTTPVRNQHVHGGLQSVISNITHNIHPPQISVKECSMWGMFNPRYNHR